MNRKKIIIASFLYTFFLLSCSNSDKTGDTSSVEVENTTDTISSESRIDFDLVRVNVHSPSELVKKLKAAKINYSKSVLLPSGKSSSFSSNYQKAIGLGAFGADLANSGAYNQPQDALEYLSQISKLATDLGISSAFDPEFSKALISNINKPDTFQIMLDKAFDRAEKNLRSNQRVATTILLITGGWIESLHLAVEGVSASPSNNNDLAGLYNDISVHCHAFNYVFDLLNAYKKNPDCAKLINELESSKSILIAIGKNPKMDSSELPKIRATVTALRNKIIG